MTRTTEGCFLCDECGAVCRGRELDQWYSKINDRAVCSECAEKLSAEEDEAEFWEVVTRR